MEITIGSSNSNSKQKKPEFSEELLMQGLHKQSMWGQFLKKKVDCSFWAVGKDGSRDKWLGHRKIRYGKSKVHWKGNQYQIDYAKVKEGRKYFEYDSDVRNETGALSFHTSDTFVNSRQAEVALVDGLVDTYIKKGGIPFLWLIICIGGLICAIIVMGISVLMLSDSNTQRDAYKQAYLDQVSKNADLMAKNQALQNPVAKTPSSGTGGLITNGAIAK